MDVSLYFIIPSANPTCLSVHCMLLQSCYKLCYRPAMIFMHGDLGWDQLQLMISKSTTADLLKMFYKLEEFFSQQFKSSKRVFSSLQPRTHPKNSSFKKKQPHTKKKSAGDGQQSSSVKKFPLFCKHYVNTL